MEKNGIHFYFHKVSRCNNIVFKFGTPCTLLVEIIKLKMKNSKQAQMIFKIK